MSIFSKMTAIADEIRAKTGKSDKLTLDEMASEIASIETGIDTSDATATAEDILIGKTAYVNGELITGSYEGVELNFEVVAYSTEEELLADTPAENTIGIITDTHITGYRFSSTEPEGINEGEVWISIGTYSNVIFDIIDDVTVYPLSVKQYINGILVDKTAKSYQNGEWVEWIIYLFNYGKQSYVWQTTNRDLTVGAWTEKSPTITQNDDGSIKISYTKPSNAAHHGTYEVSEPYDFSDKKTITVYYNSAPNLTGLANPFALKLHKNKTGAEEVAAIDLTHGNTKATLPISDIGACYVALWAVSNGWETAEPSSKSIIIEKIVVE